MSANISFLNQRAEAFTALTPAWWDRDEEYVADKYITSEEIWGSRGLLNFEYELCDVYDEDHNIIPGYKRTVRTDTGQTIAVGMTEQYKIVQPREAFAWVDGLGDMKYASAGVLNGGKQIWLLGLIPGGDEDAVDVHRKYILWLDDFTATKSLLWFPCFTRVVCENTANMAKGERTKVHVPVRHKGNVDAKLETAKQAIVASEEAFKEYAANCIKLMNARYTIDDANEFVNTLFPAVEGASQRTQSIREGKIRVLQEALNAPCNNVGDMQGTFYQLYNCVTYAVDHGGLLISRGQGDKGKSNKWLSLMVGQGAELKTRAFELALSM